MAARFSFYQRAMAKKPFNMGLSFIFEDTSVLLYIQ